MSNYHVDLDTRVDHTLDADELDQLLDALHPYGAALSGGLDDRLSVSMTISTPTHTPQDVTRALEQALQLLGEQVQVLTVDQAQVSTEDAKDTQITQDSHALPRLLSVLEVAEHLGVSRQRARTILQTDPAAPRAALQTSLGELYRSTDVCAWASARGRPRRGRRSPDELEQETTDRARRSLILASEEIHRRAQDPATRTDPLTLRVYTRHLDPAALTEITSTADQLNRQGAQLGVHLLLIDDQAEQEEGVRAGRVRAGTPSR